MMPQARVRVDSGCCGVRSGSWTMPPLTRWQSLTTTSPPARSMAEATFFATLRDASTLSFR